MYNKCFTATGLCINLFYLDWFVYNRSVYTWTGWCINLFYLDWFVYKSVYLDWLRV